MSRPRYLTKAESCEHLGVSTSTVDRWLAAGLLEPVVSLPGKPALFALPDLARCQYRGRSKAWHSRVRAAETRWRARYGGRPRGSDIP